MKRTQQLSAIFSVCLLIMAFSFWLVPQSFFVSAQGNSNGNGNGRGNGNGNGRGNDRVTICHVSGDPDNPDNYHTLTISERGLRGHIRNGTPRRGHENDTLGSCPDFEEPTDTSDDDETDTPDATSTPVPTTPAFQPVTVGAPACHSWLVYHTNRTGDWEIFRMGNAPEANNINLSQGAGAIDASPSLSPDRQWIVFTSNRDGNWELYVARTDGTLVQRVTQTPANEFDPVWSPTGTQILYESISDSGRHSINGMDLATGQSQEVITSNAVDTNPYWNPNGTSMVFQSNRDGIWQIYQYNFGTGQVQRLTTANENYTNPIYSSSGSLIAYRAQLANGRAVIRVMNTDGTNHRNVTAEVTDVDNHVWSPNDTAIAYEANVDGDKDIYIYEIATGQTRRLTANTGNEYAPTWFCNTQVVAFTADINGNSDIFAAGAFPMNAAPLQVEQSAMRWTSDPAADQYPLQSPVEENATRSEEGNLS
jgi:Tol biopolymer transport system component